MEGYYIYHYMDMGNIPNYHSGLFHGPQITLGWSVLVNVMYCIVVSQFVCMCA